MEENDKKMIHRLKTLALGCCCLDRLSATVSTNLASVSSVILLSSVDPGCQWLRTPILLQSVLQYYQQVLIQTVGDCEHQSCCSLFCNTAIQCWSRPSMIVNTNLAAVCSAVLPTRVDPGCWIVNTDLASVCSSMLPSSEDPSWWSLVLWLIHLFIRGTLQHQVRPSPTP